MSSNSNTNGGNNAIGDSEPIANSHARVAPTPKNPRDYPSFNICLVLNYTNNQIIYYYIIGAIFAIE